MRESDVYYLWLSKLKKQNKRKLLEQHGGAIELFNYIQYEDKMLDLEMAYMTAEYCEKKNIGILTYNELNVLDDRLNDIPDKPIVLYYKGKIRKSDISAAVVGSRRCTQYGKGRVIELTESLVAEGFTIISGMAKGIDSYAHTKALLMDGYTIAVLGCGLDICYPREHEKLMERIANEGLLISEYLPGTPAYSYNFPKRNRLIAALSDEIYVVEAGKKSGALITAEYGEKYGRKVHLY